MEADAVASFALLRRRAEELAAAWPPAPAPHAAAALLREEWPLPAASLPLPAARRRAAAAG